MSFGACEKPTTKYPDGRTGTNAGHRAHYNAGEQPCDRCRLAYNEYMANRRAENPEICTRCNKNPTAYGAETLCKECLKYWQEHNNSFAKILTHARYEAKSAIQERNRLT